jgi:hypothetical protein
MENFVIFSGDRVQGEMETENRALGWFEDLETF